MAAKITIRGARDLQKALRALPDRVAKKVLRQSMRAACKGLKAAVEDEAPVDTGELRDHVKIRAAARRKRGVVAVEVRIGEGDFVGKQFYAAFVNYGTARQEADPFMDRAFESAGPGARDEAISLIRQGVGREAAALKK